VKPIGWRLGALASIGAALAKRPRSLPAIKGKSGDGEEEEEEEEDEEDEEEVVEEAACQVSSRSAVRLAATAAPGFEEQPRSQSRERGSAVG
jgi:hypothetical protein